LFSYDDILKNPFEKHIEGVSNLLVLIELDNGMKVGGFAG
jgi:hypothetical protein